MSENETTEGWTNSTALDARNLESAINTSELIEQHNKITNGCCWTRFPPEPNGYLHIGHAKSQYMNFKLAFEKLGVDLDKRRTIFRYDDTNPEAESQEFIDSGAEDVYWLGWKPEKITFSSDYFHELYQFAIQLIKDNKAYICHQTKPEMEASREIARSLHKEELKSDKINDENIEGLYSPWRDRTIEENLKLFEDMKKGKYDEGAATLRLKMDMRSSNPNMWDQVAYRIKYVSHPHVGNEWCIYPTYDYTHCIIDSLEHIDYSICTLEFESRRESYFWLLEALNIYRPNVYEFSRLNITNTMMSKRKLKQLVMDQLVRGWDDARMPTIKGLRRRGYTPEIINEFCEITGVTRNSNMIDYALLEHTARIKLNDTAKRTMVVINPLYINITNMNDNEEMIFDMKDYPQDTNNNDIHSSIFTSNIYIEKSDFKLDGGNDKNFFGLSPGGIVGLKGGPILQCDEVITNDNGEPIEIRATYLEGDNLPKPKSRIHWVSREHSTNIETRIYDVLISEKIPGSSGKNWLEELNEKSEVLYLNSLFENAYINDIQNIITNYNEGILIEEEKEKEELKNKENDLVSFRIPKVPFPQIHYQFQRHGYFVLDKESTCDHLIFNLTVSLRDARPTAVKRNKSRKEEQAAALAEKEARQKLSPKEYFATLVDDYSAWDQEGMPTHLKDGTVIKKNQLKKIKKEWKKQFKLYDKYQKTLAK